MEYGMVAVPAAPVRKKPNHRREMVNQLLFGETVKVLKEKGSLWIKVRSLHDGYEGWVTNTLLQEVTETEANNATQFVTGELINVVSINDTNVKVPLGSSLQQFENGKGRMGTLEYSFSGKSKKRGEEAATGLMIEELAMQWLSAPYLWGGRTIFGVDCSGFVQVNYKIMGIDLPRDAWQQAQEGHPVNKLKDAVSGDLAFFDDKDEIVHVGILLSPDKIIHASGKVRIDTIDKKGIINSDTGKRTHTLKAVRKVI
jgi:gamma-D-glutamyl-L-lysine dipeptidyl-peptidase